MKNPLLRRTTSADIQRLARGERDAPAQIDYVRFGEVGMPANFLYFIDKYGRKVYPVHMTFESHCTARIEEADGTVVQRTLSSNQWRGLGLTNKSMRFREPDGSVIPADLTRMEHMPVPAEDDMPDGSGLPSAPVRTPDGEET